MPVSEPEIASYLPKYVEVVTAADDLFEAAGKLRKKLALIDVRGNAADAVQLGKAIALVAVAERAAMDASATLGRTTQALWETESS